jgi:ferrochelatase
MSKYRSPAEFAHGEIPGAGVLLVNLGTPSAPDASALRRYLGEFLWDPRVVEVPRALWWLILNGIVLRTRPARSARLYREIWTEDGSPLLAITQRQAIAVREALRAATEAPIEVMPAMRYGEPSIAQGLRELERAGVRRVLVLPLYPQYSAATTASTFDAVVAELRRWRWIPELRFVNHYHDDPGYIEAVADTVRGAWSEQPPSEKLLLSFHGLPKRNLLLGDPYHCECQHTARLVREHLELADDAYSVTFQSRFGRAEWLRPYTDATLERWAKDGVRSVDVICPGFAADCLETLEEIDVTNRRAFLEAGGESYRYIPALNDGPAHIGVLRDIALRHMAGWPQAEGGYDASASRKQAQDSAARAIAMGAQR